MIYITLLQELNNFVKSLDPKLSVEYSHSFGIDLKNNIIYVDVNNGHNTQIAYYIISQLFDLPIAFDPFIWALLHELGHFFTLFMVTDNDNALEALMDIYDGDNEALWLYAHCNSEKETMATNWAAAYAIDDYDYICTWLQRFENAAG